MLKRRTQEGFTLVELMVSVAIIAILMGLLTPAVMSAVRNAKLTAIKVETTAIAQAVEDYQLKYGAYPPDFSSWPVVEQHFRKLFPRISENEITLLQAYTSTPGGAFDAASIDRAEALVFTLGGYGNDPVRPLTNGGPFRFIGDWATATVAQKTDPTNFQYNTSRDNPVYEFDQERLTLVHPDPSMALSSANRFGSNDEVFHYGGTGDLIPTYRIKNLQTSYVYFDAKTYRLNNPVLGFNGFGTVSNGGVRPYIANTPKPRPASAGNFTSGVDGLKSWEFVNPDSFQLIAASLDDHFGGIGTGGGSPMIDPHAGGAALYFLYPTGQCLSLDDVTNQSQPGDLLTDYAQVQGYQEVTIWATSLNGQLDNIANFSSRTLADDLP